MSEIRNIHEALNYFVKSGAIKNRWVAGMQVKDGSEFGRIIAANNNGIQDIAWHTGIGRRTFSVDQIPKDWLLVHDPAAYGCLIALLQEVTGCHDIYVAMQNDAAWSVMGVGENGCRVFYGGGHSRIAALMAAYVFIARTIQNKNAEPPEAMAEQ